MALEKIEKKTLRLRVYEVLKEQMITAEILPGEKISLRSLADKLGVSLSPVREALLQLESERIVVIESNKSIHVNNLTPDEMEEVLKLRIMLETLAAERACDSRPDTLLPELAGMLKKMHDSMDEPIVYLRLNQKFHFTIYRQANAPILFDIISNLWMRIGPYIFLHARVRKDVSLAMKHHQAIYDALAARDKSGISKAIEEDFLTGAASMRNFLNSLDWNIDNYWLKLKSNG
ncbi:MAG: GntR family transcriptional regulator, partial [Desulfobulbaceae bacterium]|nr:GntR family transcriptional regulator [Desulfobulbaceae bacterium]